MLALTTISISYKEDGMQKRDEAKKIDQQFKEKQLYEKKVSFMRPASSRPKKSMERAPSLKPELPRLKPAIIMERE